MRQRVVLISAVVTALAALGACEHQPVQQAQPVYSSDWVFFDTILSGSQEMPPNASLGTGQAEVAFNKKTSVLRWKVTYSSLSGPVTAGHLHGPADPGKNAGVAVPFTGNVAVSPIQGEATITAEQWRQLASGKWYVNLHTVARPAGELRGQLRQRN